VKQDNLPMSILLTGGSGFLGCAMVPLLVRDTKVESIFLLLRPSAKLGVDERLESIIVQTFPPEERPLAKKKLVAVAGDLTLKDLGLSVSCQSRLLTECTHILHIGASTDFGAPIEESRFINVEGTRALLDFAVEARLNGRLKRLDYVSTAFVAGTKSGKVTENELNRNQKFANAYEQSKYEAELLVRDYLKILPITILRPSIVVGDSRNGFTPHFKVLYWPLQLLSKNLLPFIPCSRRARLDIVPIDFVADSMHKILLSDGCIGQTIYLTAGERQAVRIDDFLQDAFLATDIQRRPLIPMWVFTVLSSRFLRRIMSESFWRTCELAKVYNDYLAGTDVIFDNSQSTALLTSIGGKMSPNWRTYGSSVMRYCTESKWGKRPKMQEYEYRNPQGKTGMSGDNKVDLIV
jgi:thioester reductase-like protein